jgi:hypothetical protein
LLANGGTYFLSKFVVYHDEGNDGPSSDDKIVRAALEPDGMYHSLMTHKLDLEVTVEAFKKKQIVIDVLCFEDLYYEAFGFTWFELNEIMIERLCFFGDVCTGKLADFDVDGSLYKLQSQGVQMDMPAISEIKVFKSLTENPSDWGTPVRTFKNEDYPDNTVWPHPGEGNCLEVHWANDLDVTEYFRFELWVYLPSGTSMAYKLIDAWEFTDGDFPVDPGTDGVVDYVLGACQIDVADIRYPAWMDLPEGEFTMKVGSSYGPGDAGTYLDIQLSGLGDGYDIKNGWVGVWCGDQDANVYLNRTYTVKAYSSLRLSVLPSNMATVLNGDDLKMLNWLFNHLPDYYPDIDLMNFETWSDNHAGAWNVIQNAIWKIIENKPVSGMAQTMYNDAFSNYSTFDVLPGQWAAILFWDSPQVQVLFVMVDP